MAVFMKRFLRPCDASYCNEVLIPNRIQRRTSMNHLRAYDRDDQLALWRSDTFTAGRGSAHQCLDRTMEHAAADDVPCCDCERGRTLWGSDGILASAAASSVCCDQVSADHSSYHIWKCAPQRDACAVAWT